LLTVLPEIEARTAVLGIPGLADEPLAQALWLRMLFSALVDADFLDTESYLNRDRATARTGFPELSEYLDRLNLHLDELAQRADAAGRGSKPVMRARAQVLADCRAKASHPTGVFSLQVPTGGGKTLASLAFALQHALLNGLDRVIIAIPYTSIVEQTANVFADIFGREAIVEHHSQADADTGRETARSRLACENWDSPLIVTTNVQLFESLFAARTSRCRKLHRLQRSVIVLDEAQTLPPDFLQPSLAALRWLVRSCRTSIVSCTATQPVLTDLERFDPRHSLHGLTRGSQRPVEIVDAVEPLYASLERVRFVWPQDLLAAENLDTVAQRVARNDAVLAIVNTRRDAADLTRALDRAVGQDAQTLHLSTSLCGQHRADLIDTIRSRLAQRAEGSDLPVRVVSTQLVEAGVDIDFPVAFRALSGLDSIAQAAGRCNREGRLGPKGGRIEIFVRPVPTMLAEIRRGVEATISVLGQARPESLAPALFRCYFEHWYSKFEPDRHHILGLLAKSKNFDLCFREAARRYRLIDDEDQSPIVVPTEAWKRDPERRDDAEEARLGAALAALRTGQPDRWHLRLLQRRVVQVRSKVIHDWLAAGEVSEPTPGWFVLENPLRYDAVFGLMTGEDPMRPGLLAH
jgi:CRISPR-associated endonuclease/helicase Cas3